jgi:hypothetical protein
MVDNKEENNHWSQYVIYSWEPKDKHHELKWGTIYNWNLEVNVSFIHDTSFVNLILSFILFGTYLDKLNLLQQILVSLKLRHQQLLNLAKLLETKSGLQIYKVKGNIKLGTMSLKFYNYRFNAYTIESKFQNTQTWYWRIIKGIVF